MSPSQRAGAISDHLESSADRKQLEALLAKTIEEQELPQAILYATNRDGTFYHHSVGKSSLESDARPVKEDDVFMLASCTKLVTSIAILQAYERGLLTLDDDVTTVIPELAKQPILLGWDDDDKPILQKRQNKITMRTLLTHGCGLQYDAADPKLMQWQSYVGQKMSRGATIPERFNYPLLAEPGTTFIYGPAIDWAGLVLMRTTGKTLEEWFQENIFAQLGIKDLSFFPHKRPDMAKRLLKIALRSDEGKLEHFGGKDINTGVTDCFGGQGLYGTMGEYVKILHSILVDDGKLLKPETRKMMFTPQLTEVTEKSLKDLMAGPAGAYFVGEYSPDVPVTWGIGGMLFLKDDVGKRKAGTMQWSGAANTFWIIDPAAGVALSFGTQVFMPGDRIVAKNISQIEKAVYKMAGVQV